MFQQLFQLMQDEQMLTMNVMKKGEQIIVCTLPVAANNQGGNLSALTITALPKELDENFIQIISTPIKERFETLTNLAEFNKSTKAAAAKPQKSGSDSLKVVSSVGKSKVELQFAEAEKKEKAGDYPGAYKIYKEIFEKDKANAKAEKKMFEVWEKMAQKTIFDEVTRADSEVVAEDIEEEDTDDDEELAADSELEDEELEQIITVAEIPVMPVTKTVEIAVGTSTQNTEVEDKAEEPEDLFVKHFPNEAKDEKAVEISPKVVLPEGISPEQWALFQNFQKMQDLETSN